MTVIDINNFGGLFPSLKPRDLPADAAQTATNLDQRQPDFRPTLSAGSSLATVTSGSVSVFRTPLSGTWLSSTNDVDYAANPVQDITSERVFLSGRTTYPEAWQGGTYRRLGVPQPTTAPTAVRVAVDEYTYEEDAAARAAIPAEMQAQVKAATSAVTLGSGGITVTAPSTTAAGWLVHGTSTTPALPSTSDKQINFLFPLELQGSTYVAKYPVQHVELMDPEFGGKQVTYSGNVYMAIAFTVAARGFSVNSSTLTTSLATIKRPDDNTTQLFSAGQISSYVTYVTDYYDSTKEPLKAKLDALNAGRVDLAQAITRLSSLGPEHVAKVTGWFSSSSDATTAINRLKGTSTIGTQCLTNKADAGTLTQWIAATLYAVGAADPTNTSIEVSSGWATDTDYFHRTDDGPTATAIRADIDSWISTDGRGYKVFNRVAMTLKIRNQFELITSTKAAQYKFPISFVDGIVNEALRIVDEVFKDSYWESLPNFPDEAAKSVSAVLAAAGVCKSEADALTAMYDGLNAGMNAAVAAQFDKDAGDVLPSPEDIIEDTRAYIYTYVTDWDWESAPSPPSQVLTIDNKDTVTVTVASPPAGRNVTKIRIYRANNGNAGAAFQFVTELPYTTLTYSDAVASKDLQEVCPTLLWIEPIDALKGLKAMPNGVFIGFDGNQIHLSEPFIPYAWPKEYRLTTEHKIVGMGIVGQTAVVLTEGFPYYVSGADSSTMSAQKMEVAQACVSKRSIASADGGLLYASPDGICLATPGSVRVLTQGLLNRRDWQAFLGATNLWSSAFAAYHEGIYYILNSAGSGYALDLAGTKLSTFTYTTTALYSDLNTDKLYAVSGTSLLDLFGGATYSTGTWKSRPFINPSFPSFGCARVESDFLNANGAAGAVTLTLIGDGVVQHTIAFTPTQVTHTPYTAGVAGTPVVVTPASTRLPQRLPARRFREVELQLSGTCSVTRLTVASAMQELAGV